MSAFTDFGTSFVSFAAMVPRIATAFIVLPLMSGDIVPPLVRNVFLVSISLTLYPLIASATDPVAISATALVPLIFKEAFIGLALAFSFSIIFWALAGAGEIIDAKIGTTIAQIADPIAGHETTLTASFYSRLAAYLFVAFGGLPMFVGLLLQSYTLWPVHAPWPLLEYSEDLLFVQRFSELVSLMLLLASPVVLVLTLVEFGFGLINRFAERLNVFTLSLAAKAWVSTLVIILILGTVVEYFLTWIASQRGLLDVMQSVLVVGD